jgi:hypothetical protein
MKKSWVAVCFFAVSSLGFAGNFTCRSRTQTFVLKQGDHNLYLVYECDKNITSCTTPMVFESFGYEEDGSFELIGMRSNGQRAKMSLVKVQNGWTATLSSAYGNKIQDILNCGTYQKK